MKEKMFRKKQMNRWICLLVTAAMIFAMMPAMAFAADSDISVKVKDRKHYLY